MSPRIGGNAGMRGGLDGSAGVFRMSPSRSTEMPGLLEVLPELRQPQDRLDDAAGQHVEGDQLADASDRPSITSLAPK